MEVERMGVERMCREREREGWRCEQLR